MARRRTMYMHTLDGKPAVYQLDANGHWIGFGGYRTRMTLASSLRQIRREQAGAIATAGRNEFSREWADPKRYGYVLVEVPT